METSGQRQSVGKKPILLKFCSRLLKRTVLYEKTVGVSKNSLKPAVETKPAKRRKK
jgi:hypothetical protein